MKIATLLEGRKATASKAVVWTAAVLVGLTAGAGAMLQAQDGYASPADGTAPAYGQTADLSLVEAGVGDPEADPPARVARVAILQGAASFEPASQTGFSAAELNYPMTAGDRLYTANGSLAEIQVDQFAVRLGGETDFTVQSLSDGFAQFGLAGGSLHLRSLGLDLGSGLEVDTPNVAVTVLAAGDIRIDVDPNSDDTFVSVLSGQVRIQGNGFVQIVNSGTALELSGSETLQVRRVQAQQQDELDAFSGQRDAAYEQAMSENNAYLSPQTIGGEDLSGYGDWSQDAEYGAVWYPRGVAADWQPYRSGHWVYIAPWGWTWVGAEAWGFAPFHYGRWARFGPRWGWIPGPPTIHPVWAPALVVFVGGASVTGWFPLGPREVYTPWYRTSPVYLNRVNVTNIWTRDVAGARRIYNQRTVYGGYNGRPATYQFHDRPIAVPQAVFAGGRQVAGNRITLSSGQMAGVSVMTRPMVTPDRRIMNMGPGSKPNGGASAAGQGGRGFYRGASNGASGAGVPQHTMPTPQPSRGGQSGSFTPVPQSQGTSQGAQQPESPRTGYQRSPAADGRGENAAPAPMQHSTPSQNAAPATGDRPVGQVREPSPRRGEGMMAPAGNLPQNSPQGSRPVTTQGSPQGSQQAPPAGASQGNGFRQPSSEGSGAGRQAPSVQERPSVQPQSQPHAQPQSQPRAQPQVQRPAPMPQPQFHPPSHPAVEKK